MDHAHHQEHSRIHVQKNETVSRRIAFFDFDGTITTKDTLLEVIKYRHGKNKFYFGFLLHSPWLVAYKLGIISNQLAKEKVLRYFFRKMSPEQFQAMADECLEINSIARLFKTSSRSIRRDIEMLETYNLVISSGATKDKSYSLTDEALDRMYS